MAFVLWSFTLSTILAPARAVAGEANVGALMGMPGFRNLVFTIAMVNKAMRDAAENPMDEWRRNNVRVAISMMPQAIIGLAQVFQSGQLHDSDLPRIQALLGGFVDVGAPDNYKKFMISPDKRLIPKTGDQFPVVSAPAVPGSSGGAGGLATKGEAVAGGATVGPIGKLAVDQAPASAELANLSEPAASEKPARKVEARIGFDDNSEKGQDTFPARASVSEGTDVSAATQGTASAAGPGGGAGGSSQATSGAGPASSSQSAFISEAARDISSIEAKLVPSDRILPALRGGAEKKEKDDVFGAMAKAEKRAETRSARPRADLPASDYKLTVKPKFWNVSPLLRHLEAVLHDEAHAG